MLIGLELPAQSAALLEAHLDELAALAQTAGFIAAQRLTQKREHPDPGLYVGRGKAEEITALLEEKNIHWILCDDELSPSQQANLEKETGARVLDRALLIIEIFARRAKSREAQSQVELARMEYLLPRLRKMWSHLERQSGGIGARGGMGEKQLEIDRRIVRNKISSLKADLKSIATQRVLRRKGRSKLPQAAIVGYTNAGKSTLMAALSGEKTFIEDRLFATLDPLVRRINNGGKPYLLIDTVGFIRKLPHDLVASFQSTLEEAAVADLLLHLIDSSDPDFEEHTAVSLEVLKSLALDQRPTLTIFNKIDRLSEERLEFLRHRYPDAHFISALEPPGKPLLTAVRRVLFPAPVPAPPSAARPGKKPRAARKRKSA